MRMRPQREGHAAAPPPWALAASSLLLLVGLLVLQAFAPSLRDAGAPSLDTEDHAAGVRHAGRMRKQRMMMEMEEGGFLESALDFAKDHLDWVDPDGLRHESAWLGYDSPLPGEEMDRWYHTLTPKNSSDDTYFAVSGTKFGYLGLQQVRDEPYFQGKVVFSIWDKGGEAHKHSGDQAELVECGRESVCKRFGGEGTGVHSHINFWDWKIMNSYAFMTRAFDIGNGSVRYDGYMHAPEYGGWVLCAKIKVRRGDLPWHIGGMYSFVEHWTPREFGDARWARLGPGFARFGNGTHASESGWQQIRTATFTHTEDNKEESGAHKADVNANVTDEGTKWGLGVGGNVSMGVQNTALTVNVCEDMPEPLLLFEALEANKSLPGGCPGDTCWERKIIAFFREYHSSSMIKRTALVEVVVLLFLISSAYSCGCCCRCCYTGWCARTSGGGGGDYEDVEADTKEGSSWLLCCRSSKAQPRGSLLSH